MRAGTIGIRSLNLQISRYLASDPTTVFSGGKIRIVVAGLRGEDSIAELCSKEVINQNLHYR